MAYGERVIGENIDFSVEAGSICVIVGGSGCGKSTLLRHLIGLQEPVEGEVLYGGKSFFKLETDERERLLRRMGVLFQGGALWTSMTVGENVALPLHEYTSLGENTIRDIVQLKLTLVGLAGYESLYPAQLSGGMRKRAGLARAIAMDPEIVFFDEPSAGLDPINARHLDDLILRLKDSFGMTLVVVTHDIRSLFRIADNVLFLDRETASILAQGSPQDVAGSAIAKVRDFMSIG
jgi:phospholipid/cholesterol/gamma-HCH transport system ATP-binding protein